MRWSGISSSFNFSWLVNQSTCSGNKMAAHLARSGCRTAYPSEEEVAKAREANGDATVDEEKLVAGEGVVAEEVEASPTPSPAAART